MRLPPQGHGAQALLRGGPRRRAAGPPGAGGLSARRRPVCFDPVADRYDASRGGHGWPELAVAAIAPWLTESGPVVEVGVGTGLIASLLAARGHSLVGFDVSLRMLEQAYPAGSARGSLSETPIGCLSVPRSPLR